jgi:hypothetical protein
MSLVDAASAHVHALLVLFCQPLTEVCTCLLSRRPT